MPNPSSRARNPYYTLGVTPNADKEEIKNAYRELARRLHPDVNPRLSAAQMMKAVTESYELLIDADQRKEFDDQPRFKLRIPKNLDGPLPPPPEDKRPFFVRLFSPKPKAKAGESFQSHFTNGVTCAQFPGGKLLDAAEKEFKCCLEARADCLEARYNLGLVYYWQGKWVESLHCFKEAFQQNPRDLTCHQMVDMLSMETIEVESS